MTANQEEDTMSCCPQHTRREFVAGVASLIGLGTLALDRRGLGLVGDAVAAETLKVGGLPVT
jgi:hypothetical protein